MSIYNLTDWTDKSLVIQQAPRVLNFVLYATTTWINTIDYSFTRSGIGIDLTGHNFNLTIKKSKYDKAIVRQLTLGDGLVVGGTGNHILAVNTTVDWKAGQYVYDLIGTDPDGVITPYLKGKITVEENV